MLIELHMLQNFSPSNLNRDDTGSPKDCEFGGYRRARISSQSLKRAMRAAFRDQRLIRPEQLAVRTKRVLDEVATRLERRGRPRGAAVTIATTLIKGVGLDFKEGLSEYLLFLADPELAVITRVCDEYWDTLALDSVPADARAEVVAGLNGRGAADLALFGRMIADRPDFNVEAASQVAHALSTNRVSMEFDFYTAVDDLRPSDAAGADMLGTLEFNSATFYRYANLDVTALTRNLGGDVAFAQRAASAFLRASVDAIPSGKQNSMAAHNRPSLVLVAVRRDAACNLANAFLRPVQPGRDGDLMQTSITRLDGHWKALAEMYGLDGVAYTGVATLEPERLDSLRPQLVTSSGGDSQVDTLIQQAVAAAFASAHDDANEDEDEA